MIDYPNKLQIIFDKMIKLKLKPIIVGGYVRDFLLKIDSKDIDIEIFKLSSFEQLEEILKPFGKTNSVGKSFGVCKLTLDDLDLDFSLPRKENKIASGHKGFEILIDSNIDFTSAASRRDFSINSIGFDVKNKTILDPFNGVNDLKNKTLKYIDEKKFIQDPLRVLRAVQFCARFELTPDDKLISLCQKMVQNHELQELPKERIFEEIKKLFLKAKKISLGFKVLKLFHALNIFEGLEKLQKQNKDIYNHLLNSLDFLNANKIEDEKTNITLMLAVIAYNLNSIEFLNSLTTEKNIAKNILTLLDKTQESDFANKDSWSDYELYRVAKDTKLDVFIHFLEALAPHKEFKLLKKRAKILNILHKPLKPLIQGKDILACGMEASKEFSGILNDIYEAQMRAEFTDKKEALAYLNNYLSN